MRTSRIEPLTLGALLAVAAALRLTGIEYGLPFGNLLNPDEASIVPRAWEMTHGGGPDPKWFAYPTLLMYVLAPVEWLFGEPSYLAARVVVVLFGVGGVAAAWWLGRVYGAVAGLVAATAVAVDTTHVAYSRMAVTDVPMATAATLSLAFAVRGRVMAAAIAAGVATGFKYPAAFLLVPIAVVAWRDAGRVVRAWALAAATFVAVSPFVLIRWWSGASEDFARARRLARDGWLGFENDPPTALAFIDRLWQGLGPFLVIALAGLALALWRRERADLVLASFVLAYYANLLTIDAHFDRYVLPLVPALAALGGGVVNWCLARAGHGARPGMAVAGVALFVTAVWSVSEAYDRTKTDSRVAALPRLLAAVPVGTAIAVESSTPRLTDRAVISLELPGPSFAVDPKRDVATLRSLGVEYVLVTGAVADRVLAARDRYPREARFYDELRTTGRRVLYVERGDGLAGPWVALYRL